LNTAAENDFIYVGGSTFVVAEIIWFFIKKTCKNKYSVYICTRITVLFCGY
jgi:hypothetical protein